MSLLLKSLRLRWRQVSDPGIECGRWQVVLEAPGNYWDKGGQHRLVEGKSQKLESSKTCDTENSGESALVLQLSQEYSGTGEVSEPSLSAGGD